MGSRSLTSWHFRKRREEHLLSEMPKRKEPPPYEGPREPLPFNYESELKDFQLLLSDIVSAFDSHPRMRHYLAVHLESMRDRHSAMEDIWNSWKADWESGVGRLSRIVELRTLARPQIEAAYVMVALLDDWDKYFNLYNRQHWWTQVQITEYRRRWRGGAAHSETWFELQDQLLQTIANKYEIPKGLQVALRGKARGEMKYDGVQEPRFPLPGDITNPANAKLSMESLRTLADLLYPHYQHACDAAHGGAGQLNLKVAVSAGPSAKGVKQRSAVLNDLLQDSVCVSMVMMLTVASLMVVHSERQMLGVKMRLISTWEKWCPGLDLARILWDGWARKRFGLLDPAL